MDRKAGFGILVCIGGGEDSLLGLRYASRLERGVCADIDLLYVRPLDKHLSLGGMQLEVARRNVLDWGLELPGIRSLKRAQRLLAELGQIDPQEQPRLLHRDVSGDPVGDNWIVYSHPCGSQVRLHLKPAADLVAAVVEECAENGYDMVVIGASGESHRGLARLTHGAPPDLRLAAHAPCSIIVARHLAEGHGQLLCVDGSPGSETAARMVASLAPRCACEIFILAVAPIPEEQGAAEGWAARAADICRRAGAEPREVLVRVGDPVDVIVEEGRKHSLVVMGAWRHTWHGLNRSRSVAYRVLGRGVNSVMIVRAAAAE